MRQHYECVKYLDRRYPLDKCGNKIKIRFLLKYSYNILPTTVNSGVRSVCIRDGIQVTSKILLGIR